MISSHLFEDVYTKLDLHGNISGHEEHFVAWDPDTLLMWYLPELTPQNDDDGQWAGIDFKISCGACIG